MPSLLLSSYSKPRSSNIKAIIGQLAAFRSSPSRADLCQPLALFKKVYFKVGAAAASHTWLLKPPSSRLTSIRVCLSPTLTISIRCSPSTNLPFPCLIIFKTAVLLTGLASTSTKPMKCVTGRRNLSAPPSNSAPPSPK
jgi:hypothetical protein